MMNRRHETDSDHPKRSESDEQDSSHSVIGIVVAVIAVVLGLLAARARVLHY
jgi:hypothetical protein